VIYHDRIDWVKRGKLLLGFLKKLANKFGYCVIGVFGDGR
jgi:hypothetical protein